MEKNKVKILVSYHKDSERISSEIITPIHVGAKNSELDLNMLRDDEGINISDKNDKYCELTAQYWAWKNLDVAFYGFMHYRRHFVFKHNNYTGDSGFPIDYKIIDTEYVEEIGLNDDTIQKCLKGCDLVLPLIVDTSTWGAVSNEVQFSCLENLHAVDFDTVCKIVIDFYPDYYNAVQEFRISHYAYWYNMFVMRKEIFVDYSEWLFRILEAAEKRIDFTHYNQQETRTLAFMAERLLSIYLIKLFKDKPQLKVKFLNMTLVHNTDKKFWGNKEEIKLVKIEPEIDYVCSVEKAYKELKDLSLPYKLKDLFIRNNKLDELLNEKSVIFYGGGTWCNQFLSYFDRLKLKYPVEIWDRGAKHSQTIRSIRTIRPEFALCNEKIDVVWIITIRDESISAEIKKILKDNGAMNIIENRELVDWLSYKLWLNLINGRGYEKTRNFSNYSDI